MRSEALVSAMRYTYRMNALATEIDALLQKEEIDQQRVAELLVDHYYTYLHRLASAVLGNGEDADDAVQEGLLRALEQLDSYRPGTNLRGWLSTIVVNKSRDVRRRRTMREKYRRLWEQVRGASRSVEEHATNRSARSALWAAVDLLGEKHRLPLVLYYAYGFSVSDIASILDVREGTIHSRLHTARNQLAGVLVLNDSEELVLEILDE